MSGDIVRFGFVVEGDGEVEAVPLLTRRICHELLGVFQVETTPPVRISKSKLVREGELERAVRLVQIRTSGPIIVMLDADDDCPATLGPSLRARCAGVIPSEKFSVVIPKHEFETWFLAAAKSLGGKRGLSQALVPPPDPEGIRGAKEWPSGNMPAGYRYSPTVDQASLAAAMDLQAARSCKSFDRLCREIERMVNKGQAGFIGLTEA